MANPEKTSEHHRGTLHPDVFTPLVEAHESRFVEFRYVVMEEVETDGLMFVFGNLGGWTAGLATQDVLGQFRDVGGGVFLEVVEDTTSAFSGQRVEIPG